MLTDKLIISAANNTKTLRKQKQQYIKDLAEKTYILSYKDCYVYMLTKKIKTMNWNGHNECTHRRKGKRGLSKV